MCVYIYIYIYIYIHTHTHRGVFRSLRAPKEREMLDKCRLSASCRIIKEIPVRNPPGKKGGGIRRARVLI